MPPIRKAEAASYGGHTIDEILLNDQGQNRNRQQRYQRGGCQTGLGDGQDYVEEPVVKMTCGLYPGAPPENVKALMDAMTNYAGSYR